MGRNVLLVDIDGVLANPLHRAKYAPDWNTFYEHAYEDAPIQPVINIVRILSNYYRTFIMTGRPERIRSATQAWLEVCLGMPEMPTLFMRRNGDASPSWKWKLGLCVDLQPGIVLEDDPSVREALVSAGFVVLCPEWDNTFPAAREQVLQHIRQNPQGYY